MLVWKDEKKADEYGHWEKGKLTKRIVKKGFEKKSDMKYEIEELDEKDYDERIKTFMANHQSNLQQYKDNADPLW